MLKEYNYIHTLIDFPISATPAPNRATMFRYCVVPVSAYVEKTVRDANLDHRTSSLRH
jgi:hypothetical protein